MDYFGNGVQNVLGGLQFVQQGVAEGAERKKQNGLASLAGDFYGQQSPLLGDVARIDPRAASAMAGQQQDFDQAKHKRGAQIASMWLALPDQQKAQAWPQLAQQFNAMGLPVPEQFDPQFVGVAEQYASAFGMGGEGIKPMNVSPGGAIVDPRTGKEIYANTNFAPPKPMQPTWDSMRGAWITPPDAGAAPQGAPQGAPASGPAMPPMQLAALFSKFGGTMTSGYRSPEKNRQVGGVPTSQHMSGTGQDWVFPPQVKAQAKAFAEAQGYEVVDEGDHLHFELPNAPSAPVGGSAAIVPAGLPARPESAAEESFGQPVPVTNPATGKVEMVQFGNRGGRRAVNDYGPGPTSRENKPPTEAERGAAGYLDRMTNAERELEAVTASGYDAGNLRDKFTAGNGLLNYAASDQGQQYRQQQEDWVRAKLRKESGAVIGDEEMEREIKTYFPQPGDLPQVIANKKKSRDVAIRAMRTSAGRAIPAEDNAAPAQGGDYSTLWK